MSKLQQKDSQGIEVLLCANVIELASRNARAASRCMLTCTSKRVPQADHQYMSVHAQKSAGENRQISV